jgi:undecaprenyl diphosphate synthase
LTAALGAVLGKMMLNAWLSNGGSQDEGGENLKNNIPKSVALMLDGNGRWARKRNMDVSFGHRKGVDTLEKVLNRAKDIGIESLTVYAFSTENWKRPASEVNFLLKLIDENIDGYLEKFMTNNVKLRVMGDLDRLDENLRVKIRAAEEKTANNDGLFLNIALSYGGRAEIVNAAKNISADVKSGKLAIEEINEDVFKKYLYNPDIIYPDLLIRTGGDLRISNFLLWEISYSELYFTDVLWPDFNEKKFDAAIKDYKKRRRTYGQRQVKK